LADGKGERGGKRGEQFRFYPLLLLQGKKKKKQPTARRWHWGAGQAPEGEGREKRRVSIQLSSLIETDDGRGGKPRVSFRFGAKGGRGGGVPHK